MSAISFAKQAYSAFNREKPHSSITEWVEILTAPGTADEAYDGIPELVDSINIQSTGPAEASRAIRKKLKHGDSHQQYRALVILKALVENGGHKFQTSFADSQLTDAIKTLGTDSGTDPKVKKKLLAVLASWNAEFKDDPSMSLVANLFNQIRPARPAPRAPPARPSLDDDGFSLDKSEAEARRLKEEERKEAKRKAKEQREADKMRLRRIEEEQRRRVKQGKETKAKRKAFNYDEEKPQILTAIANASTAANNLVNAITLVNTEHDSLITNERVQECLEKAKVARKQIVRYVQLVENEEMIGTLIETNDRIIAALETYDTLSKPTVSEQDVKDVQTSLAAVKIQDSELGRLQEKQRAAVQRSIGRASGQNGKARAEDNDPYSHSRSSSNVHPDLQDLSFGALGNEKNSNLPPPIRPTTARDQDDDYSYRRGSLSDFSEYESSDEETHNHNRASTSSSRPHGYDTNSSTEDPDVRNDTHQGLLDEEDPFADPVDDDEEPETAHRAGSHW